MSKIDLRPLLGYIHPAELSYEEWLNVGMALAYEGYPFEVWDDWSRQDPARYHEREMQGKWDSFRGNPKPVTGATITTMAKARGWHPRRGRPDTPLSWDAEISDDDMVIVDRHYIEDLAPEEPGDDWDPAQEMIAYLQALFRDGDYVCYVNEAIEKDGRWRPKNGGHWDRTAGALITGLKNCKGDTGAVFGDYDTRCGMWVRFNPMDGKGAKNENVADYRYALLESDRLEIGKQIDIIKKLELPVAALVHSGNKSVHAIVRIDAPDYDEYRKRVDFLYKVAQKNGFVVDNANRNPSRLSRMPGCWRNGRKQWLIGTNLGKANWEEWQEWFEAVNDDLPDQESLASVWGCLPELAPPLIDGVLRQGHKMIISGPSKAGKSFLLIELAISIAEGLDWVGRLRCAQGRILYVNLELDRASCFHRFRDVYAAMQIPAAHIGNIDIWNLRGKSLPMDKLAPKLIRRARDKGYLAVIIDPIYKVITGDENSAEQMAHFCNQFDKICAELSCATIYCHHHSKGAQGLKKSMDRASGSGVFARDADALLDVIPLVVRNEAPDAMPSKTTAWRMSGILREFPQLEPINMWFDYPIHRPDETGLLRMACEEGDLSDIRAKGREEGRRARTELKEERISQIRTAFSALDTGNGVVPLKDLAEYLGVSESTTKRDLKNLDEFESKQGIVYKHENV